MLILYSIAKGVDFEIIEMNIPELIPAPQAPQNPQAPPGTLLPRFIVSINELWRSMFSPAFLYAVSSAAPTITYCALASSYYMMLLAYRNPVGQIPCLSAKPTCSSSFLLACFATSCSGYSISKACTSVGYTSASASTPAAFKFATYCNVSA